jgi:hypothetical protein
VWSSDQGGSTTSFGILQTNILLLLSAPSRPRVCFDRARTKVGGSRMMGACT